MSRTAGIIIYTVLLCVNSATAVFLLLNGRPSGIFNFGLAIFMAVALTILVVDE